jgi:hypothetical protein
MPHSDRRRRPAMAQGGRAGPDHGPQPPPPDRNCGESSRGRCEGVRSGALPVEDALRRIPPRSAVADSVRPSRGLPSGAVGGHMPNGATIVILERISLTERGRSETRTSRGDRRISAGLDLATRTAEDPACIGRSKCDSKRVHLCIRGARAAPWLAQGVPAAPQEFSSACSALLTVETARRRPSESTQGKSWRVFGAGDQRRVPDSESVQAAKSWNKSRTNSAVTSSLGAPRLVVPPGSFWRLAQSRPWRRLRATGSSRPPADVFARWRPIPVRDRPERHCMPAQTGAGGSTPSPPGPAARARSRARPARGRSARCGYSRCCHRARNQVTTWRCLRTVGGEGGYAAPGCPEMLADTGTPVPLRGASGCGRLGRCTPLDPAHGVERLFALPERRVTDHPGAPASR